MQPPRDPPEHVFELAGCSGVRLDASRREALQAFYADCVDLVELVTGRPPGPDEAASLLASLPPGKGHDDKFVIGLFDAPGHVIGVLDVVRDYPQPREWFVGLLAFRAGWRGRGLGEQVYRRLEAWVRASGGTAVHLIVQEQNPGALRFWRRMGFAVKGMGKQELPGNRESVFLRMTHALVPASER